MKQSAGESLRFFVYFAKSSLQNKDFEKKYVGQKIWYLKST